MTTFAWIIIGIIAVVGGGALLYAAAVEPAMRFALGVVGTGALLAWAITVVTT